VKEWKRHQHLLGREVLHADDPRVVAEACSLVGLDGARARSKYLRGTSAAWKRRTTARKRLVQAERLIQAERRRIAGRRP